MTLTLTLSTPWMQARLGTIVCKFGSDRVTFVVEEAICAKFTDRRTDGQTDRQTDESSWNELIKTKNTNSLRETLESASRWSCLSILMRLYCQRISHIKYVGKIK